jgi:hypothetical protein
MKGIMLRNYTFNFTPTNVILLIVIIAVCFFYVHLATLACGKNNPVNSFTKGSDFPVFVNGAKLIKNGDSSKIYNLTFYKDLLEKRKIKKTYTPTYTPVLYYFYLPATYMSVSVGLIFYTSFFILLYIFSIVLLILTFKRFIKYTFYIILFALLFPPFIITIINGETAVLWLFLLSASFYFSKKDMPFIAGLILSLFLMKPFLFALIVVILFFSFRAKIFSGLLIGSLFLIFITGASDGFKLWKEWFSIFGYLTRDVFDKNTLIQFGNISKRMFFYPMTSEIKALNMIEHFLITGGLIAVIFPVIYSYNRSDNFSRNSFWFIFSIALVLANPYLYEYELVILILPSLIFFNLMLADRVMPKYIFITIISLFASILLCFIISRLIHIQLFIVILWFFLINGALGKRIRNFMPKNFISHWENY